jgi:alanyl-tRNA synthetase
MSLKFKPVSREYCIIPGSLAFELSDTYGLPIDLIEIIAQERGLTVDKAGFEAEMQKQKDRARSSQKKTDVTVQSGTAFKTKFTGYDKNNLTNFPAKVLASEPGKYVITDASPFYGEMGGQVGDTGYLEYKGQKIEIVDTKFDGNGQQLHLIKTPTQISVGSEVKLTVDIKRRSQIQKHHTAAHLLDWALREKLGNHVRQAGSLVAPDRLRFDFAHFSAVSHEDLKAMERTINEKILENSPVKTYEVPFAEKPADVIAVFGEKYGDVVRVVDAGGFSKELCGGTHVSSTGEIGFFKIVGESAIAAGTRRIEAVVGAAAVAIIQAQTEELKAAALEMNCAPEELTVKLKQLKEKATEFEKKIRANRGKELQTMASELIAKARKTSGEPSSPKGSQGVAPHNSPSLREGARGWEKLPLVKAVVPDCSPDDLKNLSQMILGEIKDGVVILGSATEGKANVLAAGSKSAVAGGFNAGNVIKELTAALDGKGGGRPEMAMGSGKAVDKLAAVVAATNI